MCHSSVDLSPALGLLSQWSGLGAPADERLPQQPLLLKTDDLRFGEIRLTHGTLLPRVAFMPEYFSYGLPAFQRSVQSRIEVLQLE